MPDRSSAFLRWLLSQTEGISSDLLREGADLPAVDRLFSSAVGAREAAHLRAMLGAPMDSEDRGCTILIPGITGSLLASTRGISAILWINPGLLTNGYLNMLDLAEDGESDALHEVDIVPFGIEKLTYLRMIQALACATQLYEFPYDWRKSVVHSARQLHQAIASWSATDPGRRYSIVCHSMGGLVARTYAALYPEEAERCIERLIMVGVPLHGSVVAALAFTQQMHPFMLVGSLHERNHILQFTRSLPSVYQLLPAPEPLFAAPCPYPFDWDPYDARAWPLQGVRQSHLDAARTLHELLANADPQLDMVNFAGCHQTTVTAIRRSADPEVEVETVSFDAGEHSGDEQVPLWAAQAGNVTTYYVEENHIMLASNDSVLADITALLNGEQPHLPTALPPPGGLAALGRSWPLAQQLAAIRDRIDRGALTGLDIDKLFFWR